MACTLLLLTGTLSRSASLPVRPAPGPLQDSVTASASVCSAGEMAQLKDGPELALQPARRGRVAGHRDEIALSLAACQWA